MQSILFLPRLLPRLGVPTRPTRPMPSPVEVTLHTTPRVSEARRDEVAGHEAVVLRGSGGEEGDYEGLGAEIAEVVEELGVRGGGDQ